MAEGSSNPNVVKVVFAQVYGLIEELRAAVFRKRGMLMFKEHAYTVDELLDHPSFGAIQARLGTVDDIVSRWNATSAEESDVQRYYYEHRILVEQKLSELRKEIMLRKPTFWERLVEAIGMLLRKVAAMLPALAGPIMARLGITYTPQQRAMIGIASDIADYLKGRDGGGHG